MDMPQEDLMVRGPYVFGISNEEWKACISQDGRRIVSSGIV